VGDGGAVWKMVFGQSAQNHLHPEDRIGGFRAVLSVGADQPLVKLLEKIEVCVRDQRRQRGRLLCVKAAPLVVEEPINRLQLSLDPVSPEDQRLPGSSLPATLSQSDAETASDAQEKHIEWF